jgi:ADP-heptose:LPS heptosyltransferase
VPLVARLGARVILEVQPELVSLLAGFAGAASVIARGRKLPRFDLHCPLMSLPRAFRTTPETIPATVPYIDVSAARAPAFAQRLPAQGPLIGIAWAGRRAHHNDQNRSLPLARLAPLLRRPGTRFVSLQRDLRDGDDAILRQSPNVLDLGGVPEDFADTAALIARLDAVVAVDTAIAHLAGALGKRLFLLLPFAADFRWLRGREDTPWYPTARLVRQPAFGDWDGALARLERAIGLT